MSIIFKIDEDILTMKLNIAKLNERCKLSNVKDRLRSLLNKVYLEHELARLILLQDKMYKQLYNNDDLS